MKILKFIGIGIIALVLVVVITGYFFLQSLQPTYQGELQLEGLQKEVRVHYDTWGIPHIYGNNQEDVYRAFGYVHAQDRLWQMELIRRIAPGRLSEVFGIDLLETDIFFRTLGINNYSATTVKELQKFPDKPHMKLAKA